MLLKFLEHFPKVDSGVFIADNARVIGRVQIGKDASIWYGTVIRGDTAAISIGEGTNVQDLTLIHVTNGDGDTIVGNYVTIGHSAIIHGCEIADYALIGMGATILDKAQIGAYSLIAAGTVVSPRTKIPEGVLVRGVPGRIIRELNDAEREQLRLSAHHYLELKQIYLAAQTET